jgi:hypothetical protein
MSPFDGVAAMLMRCDHTDSVLPPTTLFNEGSASLQILDGLEWESRSDHFPLVLDLPDEL